MSKYAQSQGSAKYINEWKLQDADFMLAADTHIINRKNSWLSLRKGQDQTWGNQLQMFSNCIVIIIMI